jgi:SPP1 family predicted phage head-tail adaptor
MSRPGIAALRRRMTLEQPSRAADGGGGVAVSWTPISDLWAELRSIGGNESAASEGVQGRVTHEVTIRRRTNIATSMRLRMGTRLFAIVAVLDRDGAEPYLRILAEERNL